jgi:dTDP-4-dehydrorhamnose reductase
MKRIAITGAAGLLGQHLASRLSQGARLLCLDNNPGPFENSPNTEYILVDLLQADTWQHELERFQPEIIINCAAYSDVDACEDNHELADRMNIELPANLLKYSSARLVHYSSDYVFNGENGPYSESDQPDPINYYGRTKLESEKLLQNSGRDYLIVRTNVLYGLANNVRPNFITWLVDCLKQHKPVSIVTDQYNNPTYAGNLAEASIEALDLGLTGILHIGGADYLSRYDTALLTAKALNLNVKLIGRTSSDQLRQKARRPAKGGLNITGAREILKTKLLSLEDGLKLMYKH